MVEVSKYSSINIYPLLQHSKRAWFEVHLGQANCVTDRRLVACPSTFNSDEPVLGVVSLPTRRRRPVPWTERAVCPAPSCPFFTEGRGVFRGPWLVEA